MSPGFSCCKPEQVGLAGQLKLRITFYGHMETTGQTIQAPTELLIHSHAAVLCGYEAMLSTDEILFLWHLETPSHYFSSQDCPLVGFRSLCCCEIQQGVIAKKIKNPTWPDWSDLVVL